MSVETVLYLTLNLISGKLLYTYSVKDVKVHTTIDDDVKILPNSFVEDSTLDDFIVALAEHSDIYQYDIEWFNSL